MVSVGGLVFPVDFVIIEADEALNVPLILGRPFLATADAKLEVGRGKLTLRAGDESITFSNTCSMSLNESVNYDEHACVSALDVQVDEWLDRKLESKKEQLKKSTKTSSAPTSGPGAKVRKLYSRLKSACAHKDKKLSVELCSNLSSKEKEEMMMLVGMTEEANEWIAEKLSGKHSSYFKEEPPNILSVGAVDTPYW